MSIPVKQAVKKPVKIICAAIAVFLMLMPVLSSAEDDAPSVNALLKPQMESGEVKDLQRELEKSMTGEAKELFPYYSPKQLMEELVGGKAGDGIKMLPQKLLNFLIGEVKDNFILLLKIIIVIFLSALIKNLQGSFRESSVGELAYFACYAAVTAMVALGFQTVLRYCGEVLNTIDRITGFAIPSMLALLISSGNIVTGNTLQPVLLVAIQGTVKLFGSVFLPVCFLAGILYIVNGLSDNIKVSGMASLLKQAVAWGLTGVLMLYTSAVAIQGVTGAVIDGTTTKTAKLAMNTFIPVAGKYMADAADTIINCALIVKNTAGITVMIVTLASCILPILKIFAIMILYKFAAAIIEPVAEERMFDCLSDVSDCIKTMLGVVGAALFMFLLSIGALVGTGGISGMMQ